MELPANRVRSTLRPEAFLPEASASGTRLTMLPASGGRYGGYPLRVWP